MTRKLLSTLSEVCTPPRVFFRAEAAPQPAVRLCSPIREAEELGVSWVLTLSHKYGIFPAMKTTMELPEALFRETKAFAARKGVSMRQVVIEALASKLKAEKGTPKAKPWLAAFGGLKSDDAVVRELQRLNRQVDAEFEQVNLEEWK
jgi:hypothetical protein